MPSLTGTNRYAVLQQDLEAIKAALGQAMSQESVTLTNTEEDLARRLLRTTDPAEMLMLQVQLETIKVRKSTATYRQQVNLLGDQISAQEKRNEREQQEAAHLESLVKKYARGERIAQRLQTAFTRLRREQAQFDAEQTKALEVDLEALTEQALVLDEQLYEFDHSAETRLRDVAEAQRARVQKVLDEQKAVLREHRQSLDALVQEQTKLLTLRREYKRILEESDRFVLAKLFWLRDGQTIGVRTLRDVAAGVMITADRVQASVLCTGAHPSGPGWCSAFLGASSVSRSRAAMGGVVGKYTAAFLDRLVPGHGQHGGVRDAQCCSRSHCHTDRHLAGVPYARSLGLATDHYRRTAGTRSGVVFAGQPAMGRPGAVGLVSGADLVTPPGLDAALLGSQC